MDIFIRFSNEKGYEEYWYKIPADDRTRPFEVEIMRTEGGLMMNSSCVVVGTTIFSCGGNGDKICNLGRNTPFPNRKIGLLPEISKEVWACDTRSRWRQRNPMTTARVSPSLFVVKDKIHACGGLFQRRESISSSSTQVSGSYSESLNPELLSSLWIPVVSLSENQPQYPSSVVVGKDVFLWESDSSSSDIFQYHYDTCRLVGPVGSFNCFVASAAYMSGCGYIFYLKTFERGIFAYDLDNNIQINVSVRQRSVGGQRMLYPPYDDDVSDYVCDQFLISIDETTLAMVWAERNDGKLRVSCNKFTVSNEGGDIVAKLANFPRFDVTARKMDCCLGVIARSGR